MCLPMQEREVRSQGRDDSLEKEVAIHSSILAWRIPWTEEPGGLQSKGSQLWYDWVTNTTTFPVVAEIDISLLFMMSHCKNILHFIHSCIIDMWVISTSWLLWIMPLWTFSYIVDICFHISWADLGVKMLGHMITLCLTCWRARMHGILCLCYETC